MRKIPQFFTIILLVTEFLGQNVWTPSASALPALTVGNLEVQLHLGGKKAPMIRPPTGFIANSGINSKSSGLSKTTSGWDTFIASSVQHILFWNQMFFFQFYCHQPEFPSLFCVQGLEPFVETNDVGSRDWNRGRWMFLLIPGLFIEQQSQHPSITSHPSTFSWIMNHQS